MKSSILQFRGFIMIQNRQKYQTFTKELVLLNINKTKHYQLTEGWSNNQNSQNQQVNLSEKKTFQRKNTSSRFLNIDLVSIPHNN